MKQYSLSTLLNQKSIQLLFDIFERESKEICVVGGSIRDALIGKKSKDFDIDVGFHIGADYMLNNNFGFRSSYFLGMTDVKKTLLDSLDYKNNTFNISAIYKVKKRTKKKVEDNKDARQINTNSKLLLLENVVKLQLENYEESLTCYDKSIMINSSCSDCWHNKGVALEELGKNAEATSCFDMSIKLKERML